MSYERHPLSAAWPDMAREEFDLLCGSIAAHGQRDPIVMYQGKVLDGWHRYQACESVGRDVLTTEFSGNEEEAEALVIDKHTRRNLQPGQRAAAVMTMYAWRTGTGSYRQENQSGNVAALKDAELAKVANVSERTIRNVKAAVQKDAGALEKIKEGKATASQILRETANTKPREGDTKVSEKLPVPYSVYEKLLAERNELADRCNELGDMLEAYTTVEKGEHHAKIVELNQLVRVANQARDRLMDENAELKKQVKMQRRALDKAGQLEQVGY